MSNPSNPLPSERMSFKERWLLEDIKCEKCGQVTTKQRGITKQNLKRLITPQWNINEMIITIMIIMILVLAFAYRSETKQSREWIKEMYDGSEDNCIEVCSDKCHTLSQKQEGMSNSSNFIIASVNERTS